MVEMSLPEAAWLRPAPKLALRRNNKKCKGHFKHLLEHILKITEKGRGLIVLCPSKVSMFLASYYLNRFKPACFLCPCQKGGKTFIHPVIVRPHIDMTLPVCLGFTHVETPQHNTHCVPAFLFSLSSTSTHPLSRHTWPAARLASVNPRWRSLNKREF